MNQDKRLFLLDAYALIFRGYYAFIKNPRINSKGFNTSAVMGFMNSLFDVLNREKPTHLAVVFDVGEATVRTAYFPEYKGNRDETPEAIREGVPYIQELLRALKIPVLFAQGYEADDAIRKLAKELNLDIWDKPSMACLASRIAKGKRIDVEILKKIDKAEGQIRGLGYRQIRCRVLQNLSVLMTEKKLYEQ